MGLEFNYFKSLKLLSRYATVVFKLKNKMILMCLLFSNLISVKKNFFSSNNRYDD